MFKRILFVCTGNVCRSPMAAGLLSSQLPVDAGYVVESAGTRGLDGQPAEPLAVQLMRSRGIDLSDHRARTVTPGLLGAFDLILAMENAQQVWIQQRMPAIRERIHTLGQGTCPDVPDPMGGTHADFAQALANIEAGLMEWRNSLFGHDSESGLRAQ